MTAPEITCFHIAVVVTDVEKAIANYRRYLGDGPWQVRDGLIGRLAYGSAGGQMDLYFSVLHRYDMTLSVGYAVGFEGSRRAGSEWMVSLKIM